MFQFWRGFWQPQVVIGERDLKSKRKKATLKNNKESTMASQELMLKVVNQLELQKLQAEYEFKMCEPEDFYAKMRLNRKVCELNQMIQDWLEAV